MLSTPAILLMATKKMIQKRATMPLMKKNLNLTSFASSTVVLDDVLGMASVEFDSSAGLEDCLVVRLAVASSCWLSLPPSSLPFVHR